MIMISDRPQHAPRQQSNIRPGTNGRSFAERVEAGESARQLTQERALGFSETGLLGLHYAHHLSNSQKAHVDKEWLHAALPRALATEDEKMLSAAPSDFFANNHMLRAPLPDIPTSGCSIKRDFASSVIRLVPVACASEPLAISIAEHADTAELPVSRSFQQAVVQSSEKFRPGLRIVGAPQGMSVLCDQEIISNNSLEEFTELAHQIAKDFGVTVLRFVVNKNT